MYLKRNIFVLFTTASALAAFFWVLAQNQQSIADFVFARQISSRDQVSAAVATDLCVVEGDHLLNSGENTYDGQDVTISACTFTINGAHTFNSLEVINSGGLNHSATTTGTVYSIDITTGSLLVDGTSTINVAGWGFVGAYRTGNATATGYTTGNVTTNGSSGVNSGTGGSYGGLGGKNGDNLSAGISYGDLNNPTEPGGGGGGRVSGAHQAGNGGGLVRLTVSGTATINGNINVNGGNTPLTSSYAGGGAGGGIYLNVGTLAGSGSLTANGGNAGTVSGVGGGGGGGGRIAVHYDVNSFTGTYLAKGGLRAFNAATNATHGGAGTIFIKDKALLYGNLSADNGGNVVLEDSTPLPTTPTIYQSIILSNDARLQSGNITEVIGTFSLDDAYFNRTGVSTLVAPALTVNNASVFTGNTLNIPTISVLNGSTLGHNATNVTTVYKLDITATTLTVDGTSTINVAGWGFVGAYRTGNATSTGYTTGNTTTNGSSGVNYGTGGSHGGLGGKNNDNLSAGISYGDLTNPTEPGAGGGGRVSGANQAGNGGGLVRLTVSGTATINGNINVNGGNVPESTTYAGGGAGGGIYLNVGTLAGNGSLTANGGNAATGTGIGGGGGGGGRIAVHYDVNSFTGTYQAKGGLRAVSSPTNATHGGAGTIFIKDNAQSNGNLIVNNDNVSTTVNTPLFVTIPGGLPTAYTVNDLSVLNLAKLYIDSPCSGTALTVLGTTDTSGSGTITINAPSGCTASYSALSITTTSPLPVATVSQAYSQTLASGGGYAPKTWSCISSLGGGAEACTVKLPTGLAMSGAGVISGTPTVAGSYTFYVKVTDSNPGGAQNVERAFTIAVGNAPTAPTTLYAHSTNAQSGSASPASSLDATPAFSAIFSDADGSDTGAKYQIQVDDTDNTFASLVWDSGASGTALSSSCTNGLRCANISYGGAVLTLDGSTYYWRIRYWDNVDIVGAWSAEAQFTTDQAPTAPTVLYSNDANAQVGLTNPVGVMSARPVFSAIFNDPDLADTATKYRVQVDNDNDFSSTIWDSGVAGTSLASCGQGTRCADIIFGGTELESNEFVYYWRIKFFDAAGVAGPWSQDPISTNKFTMGAGGSSIQRVQQQQQQNTAPSAPIIGAVEVIDAHTLRYNWIDTSSNETGFKILAADNQVLLDIQSAGTTTITETNLPVNSVISGRKIIAYNANGESAAVEFATAVTAVEPVQPILLNRAANSVTFTVSPALTTFIGQTALKFEVMVTSPLTGQTRVLASDWVQANEYTFTGIMENETVLVRAYARNQTALATEPSVYQDVVGITNQFQVSLSVVKKGTDILPRPLATTDVLEVSVQIQNIGLQTATNVLVSLPLPQYIVYRGGTLRIDGPIHSDGADQDEGQADGNAVSSIWAQVAPNETHLVQFELAFDEAGLNLLRPSDTETIGNLAQAVVNPIINLQAIVSFAESDQVFNSPVISLEPDLSTPLPAEPVIEPLPEPLPEEPVVLPTPEEVQQINQYINQIIAEEAGSTEAPASGPNTQSTTVSSDGQSFNLEVTNEAGESLSLTGLATANQNQIEFTGTTSQPFSLVMLIFNDSVTAIVVSDANGDWRTFVSAEQLGIQPGQEASITIEAIASKGDLRSERTQVGEVMISLGRSGDIEADFDTTVSANNVVTAINEVRKEVVRVIEQQQPVIQTTLSVTAPVVIVSSVPLWGYLPYVPTMIYHFITYLLGLIGRKKDGRQRFYGVVYDSITKLPLPLAIVRIYSSVIPAEAGIPSSQRKLISTVVTDKLGRYEALLKPGNYTLEVNKPTYQFPSQIVTEVVDGAFRHIYREQVGMKIGEAEVVVPDVPLDPVNAQRQWQLTSGMQKVWLAVQKVGNHLAVPVLIVGSIASVATVAAVPDKGLNWVLAGIYIILLAAQIKLRPKLIKAWGVVYDIATNAVLPLTTIQLIEPQYGKVVISRLSDYQGRFAFMPEPGKYVVKATKAGFQQVAEVKEAPPTNRQPLPGEVTIEKSDQRISGDVAMRRS